MKKSKNEKQDIEKTSKEDENITRKKTTNFPKNNRKSTKKKIRKEKSVNKNEKFRKNIKIFQQSSQEMGKVPKKSPFSEQRVYPRSVFPVLATPFTKLRFLNKLRFNTQIRSKGGCKADFRISRRVSKLIFRIRLRLMSFLFRVQRTTTVGYTSWASVVISSVEA